MQETFGQRFTRLRKRRGLTQEEIAGKINISAQAVSKWENDISMPDILILGDLADILKVTIDELLGRSEAKSIQVIENKQDINKYALKIKVIEGKDKVNINLPIPLLKFCIDAGMSLPQVSGNKSLASIDFTQIYQMIEQGIIGELLRVEEEDGAEVVICVE